MTQFSFSKNERLSTGEINKFFKGSPSSVKSFPLLLLFSEQPFENNKFGVSMKGKWNAVKRNRIKRLVREVYRLNKFQTEKTYAFFFIYLDQNKIQDFNSIVKSYKKIQVLFSKKS